MLNIDVWSVKAFLVSYLSEYEFVTIVLNYLESLIFLSNKTFINSEIIHIFNHVVHVTQVFIALVPFTFLCVLYHFTFFYYLILLIINFVSCKTMFKLRFPALRSSSKHYFLTAVPLVIEGCSLSLDTDYSNLNGSLKCIPMSTCSEQICFDVLLIYRGCCNLKHAK